MNLKTDFSRELVAIEYPAKVENIDKVIESLGGHEDLSKSFGPPGEKLQLKFRNNFMAKPVLSSEPIETTGILIKVKVKRSSKNENPKCTSEIMGTVGRIYKFNNLADFQYLPIMKNDSSKKTECIYDDLIPHDLTTGPKWFRENKTAQTFLPPLLFTRTDQPQQHVLKNDAKENDDDREDVNFSFTNRNSRSSHGISIPFDLNVAIPTAPVEKAKEFINEGLVSEEVYNTVKKLFEDRPIWSLSSIRAHLRVPPKRHLSNILASIAFSFSTGPWRNCYVKFGYDPRKSFESRFYQLLDFRVRAVAGFKIDVKTRRQTASNQKRLKLTSRAGDESDEENNIEEDLKIRKNLAIFTNDTIPPCKARHYMFIDIQIAKIQDMIKNIPSSSNMICDEKRGWIPSVIFDQCRDIMSSITQSNMMKICNDKNTSINLRPDDNETRSEALNDESSENENFEGEAE